MKKFVQFWDKFSIWFYILWLIAWNVFMVMSYKCLMGQISLIPYLIYGIILVTAGILCYKFEYKHKIGYFRSTDTD